MPTINPPEQWTNYGTQRYRAWSYLGNQTSDISTQLRAFYGTRQRWSFTTGNFELMRATGRLPENYFDYVEHNFSSRVGFDENWRPHPFTGKYYRSWQQQGILGDWSASVPPSFEGEIANLRNEVIAKLREKLKETDVNLAVMAGEAKETVRMLKDLLSRLQSLLGALKSGDPGRFIRAFDFTGGKGKPPPSLPSGASAQAANVHLMYWYGIRPLMSDILGIVKALQKGLRHTHYTLKEAREKRIYTVMTTEPLYAGSKVVWTAEIEISLRAKYQVNDPVLATLTDLGLTNIPALIWELTRLSFVVDWVVGVGSWLSQIDAMLGKTLLSSSQTTFKKVTGTISSSGNLVGGLNKRSWSWTGGREYVECYRRPSSDLPVALLPSIVPKDGLFQVLTTAALLKQGAFKR